MAKITHQLQQILFCALVCSVCSLAVFGIDVRTYRQKITDARETISGLTFGDSELSDAENLSYERETIKDIRAKLGQTEKLELDGRSFDINHDWIFAKLKDFENEPYKSEKREPIINELRERLAAWETKLTELEKQEMSNRSKDENKQKLDEILRRDEFQKPKEQEEGYLRRKWNEFWEWVRKMFPRPDVKPAEVTEGVQPISSFLQIILYVVILGLIGFLIYRFAPFFLGKMKRKEKQEKKTRVILGETIDADDTSHNIFAEAETLAREGNLRGAIRKGYIALLCELNDRKIIGLARHKTNRDYLRDVRTRKEIFSDVNDLTNNFEKNWYGSNPTDEKDWEEFRQRYKKTVLKSEKV